MEKNKKFSSIFLSTYSAWVTLFLSLFITVVAWFISLNFSRQLAEDRFSSRTSEIATSIEDRMLLYEQALWGGVALFNASEEVTREDWHNYVETLEIQEKLPGVQGMGYIISLNQQTKDSIINLLHQTGFTDFEVKPEGVRDEYSAVLFLEPFDWRNRRAFGLDSWSIDVPKVAMQRAVEEKDAATSGLITLAQETEEDVQKGFVMYLPVFDEGDSLSSIEKVKGWVYAAFRSGDLMNGILGETKGFDIEIFDGGKKLEESLLFDSEQTSSVINKEFQPDFAQEIKLDMQGREWLLCVYSNEDFITYRDKLIPRIVAIGGFIIDILLFFVILSISRAQKRAEKRANAITLELMSKSIALEKRNEELTQFAYVTSHDLREPLRTIISFIELFENRCGEQIDEKGKGYLKVIGGSAERMTDLIAAILNYSRIGMSSPQELLDTKEISIEVVSDLKALIEENNASISIGDLPKIKGYKAEFQLLIQNLITNAIKFRKEDLTPEVKISYSENESHFVFKVEDNGIGIEEKHAERIFLIFQRLHSRSDYVGTGIGLAHCKKIVHLHKGDIWVESEVGVGSKFYFSILKE